MSRTFVRRAVTAAASLAVAAGSLLVAGGTASAEPMAHRQAVVTHDGSSHGQNGDHHDRDGSRWDGHSWNRHSWNGHRWDDRRWDGHRVWERSGHDWYSHDHDHRYRYDGHRFYRWYQDAWVTFNVGGGFDGRVFD
ncbi:hypothetical protein [Streptomyces carpinensis]|uniref:Uncharacterized protein n=1 Tax=Streptomyces carpinensis TaxID=66369 RepID=A0ABV1W9B5_9ACTN|nr:hypothetical protein [Streptomyces carpinensis]